MQLSEMSVRLEAQSLYIDSSVAKVAMYMAGRDQGEVRRLLDSVNVSNISNNGMSPACTSVHIPHEAYRVYRGMITRSMLMALFSRHPCMAEHLQEEAISRLQRQAVLCSAWGAYAAQKRGCLTGSLRCPAVPTKLHNDQPALAVACSMGSNQRRVTKDSSAAPVRHLAIKLQAAHRSQ
jgi:hypothetical protein